MIQDYSWVEFMDNILPQWLSHAHRTFSAYATVLRNPAKAVWIEAPSDRTKYPEATCDSLEGWRATWRDRVGDPLVARYAWSMQKLISEKSAAAQAYDQQKYDAMVALMADLATLNGHFDDTIALYPNGGAIAQADRDGLATDIEGLLAAISY